MARKRLYKRLPAAVRRMDEGKLLERVLSVIDESFDATQAKIARIRNIRSLDDLEDRYLPLVAPHVGHRWRNDRTYLWNRRRIEEAIERHSYKGSPDSLDDLIHEHGGKTFRVTDMAMMLDIWNRQGGWNRADGVCLGDGLYHPGSYVLEVDSELDFDAFLADFQYIKRAGTVWYFVRSVDPTIIVDDSDIWNGIDGQTINKDRTFGSWNRDDYWNEPPGGFSHLDAMPVGHLYSDNMFDPADTALWSPNNSPTISRLEFEVVNNTGVDGAYLTTDGTFLIDTPGLTVDMGTPVRPLEEPFVSMQPDSALISEEVT